MFPITSRQHHQCRSEKLTHRWSLLSLEAVGIAAFTPPDLIVNRSPHLLLFVSEAARKGRLEARSSSLSSSSSLRGRGNDLGPLLVRSWNVSHTSGAASPVPYQHQFANATT